MNLTNMRSVDVDRSKLVFFLPRTFIRLVSWLFVFLCPQTFQPNFLRLGRTNRTNTVPFLLCAGFVDKSRGRRCRRRFIFICAIDHVMVFGIDNMFIASWMIYKLESIIAGTHTHARGRTENRANWVESNGCGLEDEATILIYGFLDAKRMGTLTMLAWIIMLMYTPNMASRTHTHTHRHIRGYKPTKSYKHTAQFRWK